MWPAVPIPGQWAYVLGACVLLLLASAALYRGWRYDRAKGRPRCRKCAYPVAPDNARGVTDAVELAAQQRKQKQSPRSAGNSATPPGDASRADCLGNQPKPEHESKGSRGGAGGWSCPECGWSPKRVKDLTRTRRSRKHLAVSVLLLIGACALWYTIHIQYRRITLQEPLSTAATPTTWWIAMLPHRSGNEDLVVYYRAYPQAKIAGTGTRLSRRPLNGSGRVLTIHPLQHHARDAGRMAIPRWQASFGAARCRAVMQDTSRSEAERADAVWLYAELSRLDDREEVESLASLMSPDTAMITQVVFDELRRSDIAPDIVAAMAALVMEEPRYSTAEKREACVLLGGTGAHAETHVMDWIDGSDDRFEPYIVLTVYRMGPGPLHLMWHEFDPAILRIVVALLSSPTQWKIEAGFRILYPFPLDAWTNVEHIYAVYQSLRPALEVLIRHSNPAVASPAESISKQLVEALARRMERSDARETDAWIWLFTLRLIDYDDVAAGAIYTITLQNLHDSDTARALRYRIRSLVHTRLCSSVNRRVHRKLLDTLDLLNMADARDAELRAGDGVHAEPAEAQ